MKIKKNVAISESGYLFNPGTGESFSVNPIGVGIIQMLREGKSEDEIRSEMLSQYDIDADTMEKDLQDFIGFLKQYALIDNNDEKKV
ncbi:MAG: PqqD family protein [Bacteroidales bacterium]|nr:PqqD family protein [Bacteroidales bacterium]